MRRIQFALGDEGYFILDNRDKAVRHGLSTEQFAGYITGAASDEDMIELVYVKEGLSTAPSSDR